jgi:hypothetical protein
VTVSGATGCGEAVIAVVGVEVGLGLSIVAVGVGGSGVVVRVGVGGTVVAVAAEVGVDVGSAVVAVADAVGVGVDGITVAVAGEVEVGVAGASVEVASEAAAATVKVAVGGIGVWARTAGLVASAPAGPASFSSPAGQNKTPQISRPARPLAAIHNTFWSLFIRLFLPRSN